MRAVERLRAALRSIPGVVQGRSRFGSGRNAAWRIGAREFAHLHADHLLDLRLPPRLQARLRGDPRAHFRRSRSAWVELEFHTARDVADLVALARETCRQLTSPGPRAATRVLSSSRRRA